MSDETVLVTGASGFLATHCIIELLNQGYRVRGTLRDATRGDAIQTIVAGHAEGANDIAFVSADLTRDEGWEEAVSGCDYVLHVASPFTLAVPKNPEELIAPARDGALRVLAAAKSAGVKRVVLTSSVAAIAYGHKHRPDRTFTEEDWSDPEASTVGAYAQSKTLAEKAAWDFVKSPDGDGLELASVNPGMILGPVLEKDFGTSAEVIRQLMTGAMPAAPKLGFSTVDVRDVATLHILAMTSPKAAGERFMAVSGWAWMRDIADVLREAYPDRKIPKGELPNWVVHLVSNFNAPLKPILSDLGVRTETSNRKAVEMLGWSPRTWQDASLATAASMVEFGIV